MQTKDLYRSLRMLLEIDHDLGVDFVQRSEAPPAAVEAEAKPTGRAPQPAAAQAIAPKKPALLPIEIVEGASKQEKLEKLTALIEGCQRCELCKSRSKVVPGEGNPDTRIMFVGEAPGHDEDQQGRPFVGKAGQLLDRMILAMGFPREQVFIGNVLKCRPPGNRRPEEAEMAACLGYLEQQVDAIAPQVICALGNTPLKAMKPGAAGITRERGKRFEWRGLPVIPTFHPSYLLRNDSAKKPCWNDLKAVLEVIGLEPPKR